MFTALPTKSLRVSELLSPSYHFTIPTYQRPYSWTIKEAGQLLEDILAASGADDDIEAEPDYFFGTILVVAANGNDRQFEGGNGDTLEFEIVDGQQRLVTLTILACVLRDLDDNSLIDGIRDRLEAIVGGGQGNGRAALRIALRGREQAFMAEHVQTPGACRVERDGEGLNVGEAAILAARDLFMAELSNLDAAARMRLAAYLLDACHMVVILTRDMDRAHRMFMVLNERGKPLLRNDILKAEVLHSVPEAQAPRVLEAWEGLAGSLGPEFEAFFSHVRLIHGHARPQVIAAIRLLVRDSGDPMRFLDDVLVPLAGAYRQILDAGTAQSNLPPEIDRRLYYLKRLKGADWVAPAMLALNRHRNEPQQLTHLINEIDRLAHVLRLLCLGNGKRARRFADVVEAIKAGQAGTIDAACFQIAREEVRSITFNLRDLYGRSQAFSKLVVMRLGDIVDGRLAPIDPGDVSVEHVLPQRPGQNSAWRTQFPDPVTREAATKSLGNLVIVDSSINDKARNKEFAAKRELYAKSHPMPPLLSEVIATPAWTMKTIRAREEKLLLALTSLWRIDVKGAAMAG